MRLIDSDELINILEWNKGQDRDALVIIDSLIKLVKARPTAYDVDKVVEELGEIKVIGTYPYDVVKEAIEIVKGGGIDGFD